MLAVVHLQATSLARKHLRRLVRPGKRALAIGLGVGTAVSGLQQHGITVDVIELHREVRLNAKNNLLRLATLMLHLAPASQKLASLLMPSIIRMLK